MSEKLPIIIEASKELTPEVSDSISSSLRNIYELTLRKKAVINNNPELFRSDGSHQSFNIKFDLFTPERSRDGSQFVENPNGGIRSIQYVNDKEGYYEMKSDVLCSDRGPIPLGFDLYTHKDGSSDSSHVLKVESKNGEDIVEMLDDSNPTELAFKLLDRVEVMQRADRIQNMDT